MLGSFRQQLPLPDEILDQTFQYVYVLVQRSAKRTDFCLSALQQRLQELAFGLQRVFQSFEPPCSDPYDMPDR